MRAARIRASASNSAIDSVSARRVGRMPACSSKASPPRSRRLLRSILRRWPNAAAVTRSNAGQGAGSGDRRGVSRTTAESTLGGGQNARAGSVNNGLTYLVEKFKHEPLAAHVTLTKGERSPLAELAANIL